MWQHNTYIKSKNSFSYLGKKINKDFKQNDNCETLDKILVCNLIKDIF